MSSKQLKPESRQSRNGANRTNRDLRNSQRLSQFVKKKQMVGGKFTPPANPPDITFQPWNPITLMDIYKKEKILMVPDVVRLLKKQCDPKDTAMLKFTDTIAPRVQFKVLSIAAWNLTGRVISLSVSDFLSSGAAKDCEQLAGLVDAGTTTHTPAVGYSYPSNYRQHVLRNGTDDLPLLTLTAGSSDQICLQLKILYKFDGPVTAPTTMLAEALMLESLANTSASTTAAAQKLLGIDEVLKRLNKIAVSTNSIAKKSYVDKIIDGVKHTAMLVAAVADETEDDALIQKFTLLGHDDLSAC